MKQKIFLLAVLAITAHGEQAFDQKHGAWEKILKEYAREGLVDYKKLKAHPGLLEDYLDSLGAVKESDYNGLSQEDQIAFWINAYNALTVKAIVDHYPIKPSWKASLLYPKNSIRQIPGVWDKLKFRVMNKEVTLDQIEHGILRKRFKEPRIHMALVCASRGCPILRGEAFVGAALHSQLDDQARIFLRDPSKFRMARDSRLVYLSPIFEWFSSDFARPSVLSFIAPYLDEADRQNLSSRKFKIKYLDYDWSLNELGP